jgi:hypothetical protein
MAKHIKRGFKRFGDKTKIKKPRFVLCDPNSIMLANGKFFRIADSKKAVCIY